MIEQTHADFTRIVAESLESEGLVWRYQFIPHADWSWNKRALAAEAAVQGVLNLDLRCDDYYDCYVPGKPLKHGACLPCSVRAAIAKAIEDGADL